MLNSSKKKTLYGSVQTIPTIQYYMTNSLKKKSSQDNCEVICYFDMQEKYGMGYLLSNGNYGVIFNDKTSLTKLEPS